jgi:hypothetical protein
MFLAHRWASRHGGRSSVELYYDARLYSWDISTIWAIEAGIQSAYAEEATIAVFVHDGIETPLPGAPYSLWPRHR